MRKIIILLSLFISVCVVQAQPENPDSLINILNTQKLTPDEQLSIYNQLRGIYSENDAQKSNLYARKGLLLAEKVNNKEMASVFYGQIGVNYYTMSIYDTAAVYLEKALNLAIAAKDSQQEGSVNIDLGNLYRRQNQYEPALEKYMRAIAIFDSIGNKVNYATALINISDIHRLLQNYDREVHFLKQAEEISKNLDDPKLQMLIYYRIANIYNRHGPFNDAILYAGKANEISRMISNRKYEIATLNVIAIAYAKLGNYDESMKYAGECIQLAEKYDDKRLLTGVTGMISDIYLEQKRYQDYADLLYKVWMVDSTDLIYATDAAESLIIANIHLGNKDKTLYFLDKFCTMVNQRTDKNMHEALADMEVKYDTEKKELRISTLEKEKQFYLWMGLTGTAVLLLAFGALFYRHRLTVQKRKVAEQQREIAEQQRELAEQQIKRFEQEKQLIATQSVLQGETTERSRLARDLHDGLGGLLSVVRLNLKEVKGNSVMDHADVMHLNTALGMLDESIGELRRVAHHIMPESLMRYGLRESLDDFCRAIPGTSFQYYGSDARLDSQLELLIYRCAHELVNNAVKHANATAIDIQLMADNGLTSLTVRDNGCGFDPTTIKSGTGLDNIRTRASAYNGKIHIYTTPGKGTEINIEIVMN